MALSGKSGVSGGIDIRGTAVGEAVFTAGTTAAAQAALGGAAVGQSVLGAATTAAAQNTLGGGTVGKALLGAATTAAANNTLGLVTANQLTAYTSGAASYSFTASADSVVPANGNGATITLSAAGTYLILAKADILHNGSTFAASRAVTLKLRRMNNTAADLTNGSITLQTGVTTTLTSSMPGGYWWVVYTTTATDDIINILASVGTVPSAGSLDITNASIVAYRLQQ